MRAFRTKTNHELNAYRARLDEKLHELIDYREGHAYVTNPYGETFLITYNQKNEIDNPNGNWKWNGWVVTGRLYQMYLYAPGEYDPERHQPNELPLFCYTDDSDKDTANRHYLELKSLAETFRAKDLLDMSPVRNNVIDLRTRAEPDRH